MLKRVVLLTLIAVGVIGCESMSGILPSGANEQAGPKPMKPGMSAVLIEAGDKLLIDVPQAERFNGIVEVAPDGQISHPTLGVLRIAGLDNAAAGQLISDAIQSKRELQPHVRVSVLNYQPIMISGEVVNTGKYPYILGLNLPQVLIEAGGLTYRADSSRAFVTERKSGAKREVRITEATTLKPGDHIQIPQRYFD